MDVRVGKGIDRDPAVIGRPERPLALLVAILVLVGGSGVQVQESTPAQNPPVTFRAAVEAVSVSATVRDGRGRVVRDLTQADFQVLDSGLPVEILDFWAGDSPVSLGIVLDISGSMAVGGNIHRARQAVDLTLANMRYGDEAALFTFDSRLEQVVPFTTDLDLVKSVNLGGTPFGTTSLYDAIAETARLAADRSARHRAVLVITDGVDVGSKLTAAQVSGIASSIDVPVYLLTVVSPVDHRGGQFEVIDPRAKDVDATTLEDLARWTGGDMRIASVPAHTLEGVLDLLTEIRHQYVITFEPGSRPGWHPLEIRTRQRNLVVRARGGYLSGPARVGSE
jgi:Ca-activated chloride channel family protein